MRHKYAGTREKRIDFWLGFVGWFVVNVLAILVIALVSSATSTGGTSVVGPGGKGTVSPASSIGPALSGVLVLANVVAPILFAFTRGYVALGMLMAFATAFAATVIEGVFFTISDFAVGSTVNSGGNRITIGLLSVGFLIVAIGAFFILRRVHRSIK